MFGKYLAKVRETCPLVHNITNYVTVNDCANALLAIGASPIMADDPADAEEITEICAALNLNIGTLNSRTIPAMFAAGRRAAALGHKILLDPVGAGASAVRTGTALRLLAELPLACVRGNASEIKALAVGEAATRGVDASDADAVTAELASAFAVKHGLVVAVTGATDTVTDGKTLWLIDNGDKMMSRVTGTGCMLSAITAAFLAANPDEPLEAVAAAVAAMGYCGEKAAKHTRSIGGGNITLRDTLIDNLCNLTPEELDSGEKVTKGAI